jgi:hypothetical protein
MRKERIELATVVIKLIAAMAGLAIVVVKLVVLVIGLI